MQVRSDSALLAAERAGSGPALVCLHAGVADRRMFDLQMPDLGLHFDVLRYDRRGFGRTTTIDEPFSHVADLGAVLDAAGMADAVVLGCSQGGRVAVDFALAHPQRVRALVLISSAISGAPAVPLPSDLQALADDLEAEAGDLNRVNEIEAHMWLDGPRSPRGRVGGAIRALFLDMNRIALEHLPLPGEQQPACAYERLEALKMPILLIHGDLDFPHVVERHVLLAQRLPHAHALVCKDNAHLVPMESPTLVNAEILAFCRSRGLVRG